MTITFCLRKQGKQGQAWTLQGPPLWIKNKQTKTKPKKKSVIAKVIKATTYSQTVILKGTHNKIIDQTHYKKNLVLLRYEYIHVRTYLSP